MRVLFVYPNTDSEGCMPIGIAVLSAVLKQAGHETKLFDTTFFDKRTEKTRNIEEKSLVFKKADMKIELDKGDMKDAFKKAIESFKPNLIAVSATSTIYPLGLDLLKRIQNTSYADIPVIVGGSHPTVAPEKVIAEDCIDMICIGEGEGAMLELCNKMKAGRDIADIKNIWLKKDGKVIKNEVRPFIENLDVLPYPDWSLFDDRHLLKPFVGKVYRFGQFEMSRGCPYSCTYCINRYMQSLYKGKGRYHRTKSMKKVSEEIKYFKEKYNLTAIKFWDETFLAMDTETLREFFKFYKDNVALPFLITTRPETIDEERVKLLKGAGCVNASIGIESGDEEFRRRVLNRFMTNECIVNAFHTMKKNGIRVSSFNMIGLPYETRENIFKTIELNKKCNADSCTVTFFYPFDGTVLKDVCLKEGYIDENPEAINIHEDSILKMPQISEEELIGLKKTFMMYVNAPKYMYSMIKLCESNNPAADALFDVLSKYFYFKMYGFSKKVEPDE